MAPWKCRGTSRDTGLLQGNLKRVSPFVVRIVDVIPQWSSCHACLVTVVACRCLSTLVLFRSLSRPGRGTTTEPGTPLPHSAIPPSSWLLHEMCTGKLSGTLKAFHRRVTESTKDQTKPAAVAAKEIAAAHKQGENAAIVRRDRQLGTLTHLPGIHGGCAHPDHVTMHCVVVRLPV